MSTNPPMVGPSDFLSPVVTSTSVNITAVNGATGEPDPTPLMNPNRTAMLVDCMRFRFPIVSNILTINSQIQAELWLGGISLTNGPQPLGAFCPSYTGYALIRNQLTWNLPRPLYVPPNVPINAKFTQKLPSPSGVTAVAGEMGIAVAGRSMPSGFPIPKEIYVPWVSSTSVYKTTDSNGDAIVSWESADNELGNPFSEPMHLTRLVGWNGRQDTQSTPSGALNRIFANHAPDFTIQATFSNQKMLIRDPAPFFSVFPGDRPFMRLNNTLMPKEFIRVYLNMTPTGDSENLNFTTVGMVGYRALSTPMGALP